MFLDSGPPEPERRDSAPRLGRSMRNRSSLRQKEGILPAVTVKLQHWYRRRTADSCLRSGLTLCPAISHNEKKTPSDILS